MVDQNLQRETLMQNVLITGAGGFLGSHLVKHLDGEFSVTVLTRKPIAFRDSINEVRVDLSRPDWTDDLERGADTVIHLAQSRDYRNFLDGADDMLKVNVQSTVKLLDWAHRNSVNRFILASTGNVYAPQPRPLTEEDPCEPSSFYAATKLSAELLCRQYANEMEIVIVRFFGIYGPRQSKNLVHRWSNMSEMASL